MAVSCFGVLLMHSWNISVESPMPSHQTPAQKAANRAFHNKEEAKKGKRVVKKTEQEESKPKRPVSRKNRKANLSRPALWFIAAAICGGVVVQLFSLINSVF